MTQRQEHLGEAERNALNGAVGALRRILEEELRRVLEGTFGIRDAGEPEDESRLSLTADQLVSRHELLGLWHFLERRTDLLVREAAFTHVNRLIAIRVAEALGLVPQSIAEGRRSSGFRQLLEVAPLLGSDDDAGYWAYLQICGDELAHDIPRLFDPRNPLLALRPPPAVVDSLVALIRDDSLGEPHKQGTAWAAPDTLGWTYQFFNSDAERGEMRKAHPQPADSRELAVRNQFFTPDYVVRFLAQNSLGRRLVEGGFPELIDTFEFLVNPAEQEAAEVDLADVRVLDPACGSGHFLLGTYDILEDAWQLRGVDPGDAAPAIIQSLWGVDIDARATQVAAAAVIFRARRHRPDGELPAPNIVCSRAVPGGASGRAELLASVDASQRDFLSEVIDQLERAPELGSLLKIEAVLTGETARRLGLGGGRGRAMSRPSSGAQTSLIDDSIETGSVVIETLVDGVLDAAQAAADRVTSTPEERVLAADGGDALRLIEVLSQRYDAVLMNPPFGEPIPDTKAYLKTAYPWHPTKDYNLLALFVGRGLQLCKPEGYLGAITSRAGLFLSTFQRWRQEILLDNDLTVLADLGHKVMHEALVEAAAYVVRPATADHDRPATFIRLLRESPSERDVALVDACAHVRDGVADGRVFAVAPSAFDAIPGSPMSYWMSPSIRRLFTDYPPLEGDSADVRVGLQTGDDFRFVRAFWEVDPSRIARTREETFDRRRWVPFAKGGEYSPFWADIHLVVDFERDAERLRQYKGARPQNLEYSFRSGITWPRRTQAGFNPSVLPAGCVFADKGPGVFVGRHDDAVAVLGMLLARPSLLALGLMTTFGSYEVGAVARVPSWLAIVPVSVPEAALAIIQYKRHVASTSETSGGFLRPQGVTGKQAAVTLEQSATAAAVELLERWTDADRSAVAALRLDPAAEASFDDEVGVIPALPASGISTSARVPRFVDGDLETEASKRGQSVSEIVSRADNSWWNSRPRVADWAAAMASYLVGCAVGRWDVRVGRDPTLAPPLADDPFLPVPVCPPGMLVGLDGLPVQATSQPDAYSIPLTGHRVVIDEAGHPADIVALVEAAAQALADGRAEQLVGEICFGLGVPDLRAYLRRRFFRDHLARYSKSRRKAPLYWPLTIPSRTWTVWLYAPTLSREAIYAAAAHAERRRNAAEGEIRRLESAQLQASTPGASHDLASVRAIAKRLDDERGISEELRSLHTAISRIASTGWTPDLDDGIVVCAAPFADVLLDWPKDPADARRQLRGGKLDWTSAHRWREQL